MTILHRWAFALFVSFCCLIARAAEPVGRELWVYYPTNLLVDQNIDKLRQIWGRVAQVGYTHVLMADSKFWRLGVMDKRYLATVEAHQADRGGAEADGRAGAVFNGLFERSARQ